MSSNLTNYEKIVININSLMSDNEYLLREIRQQARSIETLDTAFEERMNEEQRGKQEVTTIARTSSTVARGTFNDVRILHRRIQENCVAIQLLVDRLPLV